MEVHIRGVNIKTDWLVFYGTSTQHSIIYHRSNAYRASRIQLSRMLYGERRISASVSIATTEVTGSRTQLNGVSKINDVTFGNAGQLFIYFFNKSDFIVAFKVRGDDRLKIV